MTVRCQGSYSCCCYVGITNLQAKETLASTSLNHKTLTTPFTLPPAAAVDPGRGRRPRRASPSHKSRVGRLQRLSPCSHRTATTQPNSNAAQPPRFSPSLPSLSVRRYRLTGKFHMPILHN
ncbi:hypothetical protein PIB30_039051 [Stylosanthes scabra]|uniref:Uncharacterized protein n=1 Tax=Stylosanthes scabra TaxID=79078 RepID=A0ABU6TDW5_9FABA|nr:hypothetical protein [Stylosanthes scabra]